MSVTVDDSGAGGGFSLQDASYEDLLSQLAQDLPTYLTGVVQSSIGGSPSGSISQPAQGYTLVWDTNQQLFVPSNGQLAVVHNTVTPFTAASNSYVVVSVTTSTINLPANPSNGDVVVVDAWHQAGVTTTVSGNGHNIWWYGAAYASIALVFNQTVRFTYNASNSDWRTDFPGPQPGAVTYSKQGYSISTTSSTSTLLDSFTITTTGPSSRVLIVYGISAYTSTAGSEANSSVTLDNISPASGPPGPVSFFFNGTGTHMSLGPYASYWTGVTPGAHTIRVYVAAWFGQLTMDANDHLSAAAWEM